MARPTQLFQHRRPITAPPVPNFVSQPSCEEKYSEDSISVRQVGYEVGVRRISKMVARCCAGEVADTTDPEVLARAAIDCRGALW